MKKLLLVLTFALSICILSNSDKITNPSKFLLKEIIPDLADLMPSEQSENPPWDYLNKIKLEVYKNNKWDNQKVKNYNENEEKIKVIYYYSNNKLGKIVKEVSGKQGQELEVYYLKGQEPIYAVFRNMSHDNIKLYSIEEIEKGHYEPIDLSHYYFIDNKLFYIVTVGDGSSQYLESALRDNEKIIRKKLNILFSKE